MFYVIRTLTISRDRLLVKRNGVSAIATREEAEEVAARFNGSAKVHEFASDAEARMYLDPAFLEFRVRHDNAAA